MGCVVVVVVVVVVSVGAKRKGWVYAVGGFFAGWLFFLFFLGGGDVVEEWSCGGTSAVVFRWAAGNSFLLLGRLEGYGQSFCSSLFIGFEDLSVFLLLCVCCSFATEAVGDDKEVEGR